MPSVGAELAEPLRPTTDGAAPIQMSTHQDVQADATAPSRLGGDLQDLALETDRVVAPDDAFFLVAQAAVQIDRPERDEGAGQIPHAIERLLRVGHRCFAAW